MPDNASTPERFEEIESSVAQAKLAHDFLSKNFSPTSDKPYLTRFHHLEDGQLMIVNPGSEAEGIKDKNGVDYDWVIDVRPLEIEHLKDNPGTRYLVSPSMVEKETFPYAFPFEGENFMDALEKATNIRQNAVENWENERVQGLHKVIFQEAESLIKNLKNPGKELTLAQVLGEEPIDNREETVEDKKEKPKFSKESLDIFVKKAQELANSNNSITDEYLKTSYYHSNGVVIAVSVTPDDKIDKGKELGIEDAIDLEITWEVYDGPNGRAVRHDSYSYTKYRNTSDPFFSHTNETDVFNKNGEKNEDPDWKRVLELSKKGRNKAWLDAIESYRKGKEEMGTYDFTQEELDNIILLLDPLRPEDALPPNYS